MAFPRGDGRVSVPIKGSFKIQVRRPVEAVVGGDPDAAAPRTPSEFGVNTVSVPPGFSVTGGTAKPAVDQFGSARDRLAEIGTKGCAACRRQASAELLGDAARFLNHAEEFLRGVNAVVVLGQRPGGEITVNITHLDMLLTVVVYKGFMFLTFSSAEQQCTEVETHLHSPLMQACLERLWETPND